MSFVLHFTVFDPTCQVPAAPAPPRLSLCVAFGIIMTVLVVANAKAQDAEPRSYTNTPVGLNFLIAGYLYSEGKIAFRSIFVDHRRTISLTYRGLGLRAIARCRG